MKNEFVQYITYIPSVQSRSTKQAVDATITYPIEMAVKIQIVKEREVIRTMIEAQHNAISADASADDMELRRVSYTQKSKEL